MPSSSTVAPSSATSLFPLFTTSNRGRVTTVKTSKKTPYDRPSATCLKEEDGEPLPVNLSILHRPPPSFPLKLSERSAYLRPEIGDGKSKGKVTAFQWKVRFFLFLFPFFLFIDLFLHLHSSLPVSPSISSHLKALRPPHPNPCWKDLHLRSNRDFAFLFSSSW
jgi:hypothetical protein